MARVVRSLRRRAHLGQTVPVSVLAELSRDGLDINVPGASLGRCQYFADSRRSLLLLMLLMLLLLLLGQDVVNTIRRCRQDHLLSFLHILRPYLSVNVGSVNDFDSINDGDPLRALFHDDFR